MVTFSVDYLNPKAVLDVVLCVGQGPFLPLLVLNLEAKGVICDL